MKVYIHTEDYGKDTKLYGYNLYINNELSESLFGIMKGTDEEVTDVVTKNMFAKNKDLLDFDKLVTLKYKDLPTTKQMTNNIYNEPYYQQLSNNGIVMFTSPSIFLSDNEPFHKLKKQMNEYKLKLNYYMKPDRTK